MNLNHHRQYCLALLFFLLSFYFHPFFLPYLFYFYLIFQSTFFLPILSSFNPFFFLSLFHPSFPLRSEWPEWHFFEDAIVISLSSSHYNSWLFSYFVHLFFCCFFLVGSFVYLILSIYLSVCLFLFFKIFLHLPVCSFICSSFIHNKNVKLTWTGNISFSLTNCKRHYY